MFKIHASILTLLAVTSINSEAANLVQNGSFDNLGSVFVDSNGFGLADPGVAIPDWNGPDWNGDAIWAKDSPALNPLTSSPDNGSPYWIVLNRGVSLYQTLNTEPGVSYVLTFDLGATTPTPNLVGAGLEDLVTGVTDAANVFENAFTSPNNQWVSESLSFTAESSQTRLLFESLANPYVELDNVAVNAAVPEPSNAALLLAGLGVVGWVLRKRRPVDAPRRAPTGSVSG